MNRNSIIIRSYHMWSLIHSQQTDYKSHFLNSCILLYILVHRNLMGREYCSFHHKIQCNLLTNAKYKTLKKMVSLWWILSLKTVFINFFIIPVHVPFISRKSGQHLQKSKNIFNLCIFFLNTIFEETVAF